MQSLDLKKKNDMNVKWGLFGVGNQQKREREE
jgi:hypothetical protein